MTMIPIPTLFVAALVASNPAAGNPGGGGPEPVALTRYVPPSALLLPQPLPDLALLSALLPPSPCEDTAWIARRASRRAAFGDYLLGIANCVQEGGFLGGCALAGQGDLFAAYLEFEHIYDERLAVCQLIGSATYDPVLDPSQFCAAITNPYLPFVPGRTLVYREVSGEGVERTRVKLRPDTLEIAGIECAVARDIVRLDGVLIEDTDDWYAQDLAGNVWYMGEIAKNYEDGMLVDLDGSWTTGVDHAKPGIVMRANPQVGDCYRQEFLLGEAEDMACVVATDGTAVTPYGTFTNCVVTEDYTPLEPGVRERKYYASGIGFVLSENLVTGLRNELVNIIGP